MCETCGRKWLARWCRRLGVTALVVVASVATAGGQVMAVPFQRADEGAPVGKQILDFQLKDLDGHERSFAELHGEVTLVNFWATWCIPCRAEMPDLDALYRDYKDHGLVVLGIARDPHPGPVREFLSDQVQVSYLNLIADAAVEELFGGIPGIPMTFLLDREGVVREQFIGFRYRRTYEEAIRTLLAAQSASETTRPGGALEAAASGRNVARAGVTTQRKEEM